MSEAKKHGLGRGLSALMGDVQARPEAEAERAGEGVRDIEVARIRPNPSQPRRHFDEEGLAELAQSISQHGLLQPILVRPAGDTFEIIAGERRWRAAQKAQLHAIPALVREFSEMATAEAALIENIQRADLNAIEEAAGYKALMDRFNHSQVNVGQLVGKSRSHVSNLMRLLELPDGVQQMLVRGDISMGHARAVLGASDPQAVAGEIARKGLSVRQAEALVKKGRQPLETKAARPADRPVDTDLAALERQLADMLGLKVKVHHHGAGGTVSLSYSSLDQLDMICQRLSGEVI